MTLLQAHPSSRSALPLSSAPCLDAAETTNGGAALPAAPEAGPWPSGAPPFDRTVSSRPGSDDEGGAFARGGFERPVDAPAPAPVAAVASSTTPTAREEPPAHASRTSETNQGLGATSPAASGLEPLHALSPLDGRYAAQMAPLRACFSEAALIAARAEVELRFLLALDPLGIFPPLSPEELARLAHLRETFGEAECRRVKELEATLRHDVKALELVLRERLGLRHPTMIHFGLTSEDVNNLAYSLLLSRFRDQHQVPLLRRLLGRLADLAEAGLAVPFPTRTHGQPASPSTAGKELAVFLQRLRRLLLRLTEFAFRGKCSGATGTYAAWMAADPHVDWIAFSCDFVQSLGFEWNPLTTQIEDHDGWAEFLNLTRQINNVVIDLDQDAWLWMMEGWYRQSADPAEIGSSTMPHKVNPIRFENSEGNLLLANALLGFMADKLCRSRLQRDLSDSTVTRNLGVALGHSWLGWQETLAGLATLQLDQARCLEAVRACPAVLAEPVQTMLRPVVDGDPYDRLRTLTRGRAIGLADLAAFIDRLEVDPDLKRRLRELRPETYLGEAVRLAASEIGEVRSLLGEVQP
ncbi:MAG: Adenylosuccinate lyase [Candidatus Ozemobacter sibiricus]|uniref:Adenylosuccinate lyase n=1 Tax=Candidatus Ozemobacter sibiricus TaxID=2268124 RepID=A0A367ZKV0_9BACT|nr:MAG: Adenylosuccinate lyase [Candidatus Ozemobacter sibiricus]